LFGSFQTPFRCFGVVLGHSLALLIKHGEVVLSFSDSIFSGEREPSSSLAKIDRKALPAKSHIAELIMRFREPELSRSREACPRMAGFVSLKRKDPSLICLLCTSSVAPKQAVEKSHREASPS